MAIANEPTAPAQPPRSPNERAENCDKEREIELYYELLCSGHSVREILNGIDPVEGKSEQAKTAATEQPQSRRDSARAEAAAEVAVTETWRADAQSDRGAPVFRQADIDRIGKPRSASSDAPARGGREQGAFPRPSGPGPRIIDSARAYILGPQVATGDAGDRERFWSRKLSTMATSIGFWALYTGAVAAVSVAGFTLVRGERDANSTPPVVQSSMFPADEAPVPPISTEDRRGAAAEGFASPMREASIGGSQAPPPPAAPNLGAPNLVAPNLGAPNLDLPGALQPVASTDRKAVSPDRRDTEAARQSTAADPDAIGELVERLLEPVEPPAGPAPAPPAVQSVSAAPARPAETTSRPDAGEQKADGAPHAAPQEESATATVAPSQVAAPPPAHAVNSRHAHASRREARLRRPVGRRPTARAPQPGFAAARGALGPGQGLGAYDMDGARGYGQGAYGPSPYSDLGN